MPIHLTFGFPLYLLPLTSLTYTHLVFPITFFFCFLCTVSSHFSALLTLLRHHSSLLFPSFSHYQLYDHQYQICKTLSCCSLLSICSCFTIRHQCWMYHWLQKDSWNLMVYIYSFYHIPWGRKNFISTVIVFNMKHGQFQNAETLRCSSCMFPNFYSIVCLHAYSYIVVHYHGFWLWVIFLNHESRDESVILNFQVVTWETKKNISELVQNGWDDVEAPEDCINYSWYKGMLNFKDRLRKEVYSLME